MSGERRAIEHLVFSTRAAEPRSGTEFNREVIAASSGVPEVARRELARLGDMTGPVLRRPGLPPLWAFRRLDEGLWLVVRAVSLGLYRKGHHQLLVHGVVLPREVLEELEGDPFLLDGDEARRAGFRFLDAHPGGRSRLDPIPFAAGFTATARRLVRERFLRGSERYGALDPAFPALHDAVRDRTRPTVWSLQGPPDPGFLEWLLLHFHPADRADLSFHTWYAYEQAVAFDLIGAAPEDVSIPRRLLREVRLWSSEAPEAASELGVRVRELRRRDPDLFLQSLERYYFTLLEGHHRLDVRRKVLAPLKPREEALLCLRKELGEALTPGEEETVGRLARRGQAGLSRHAADLADAWRQGPAAFRARLERLVPGADAAARSGGERDLEWDLDRLPPVREPEERLGLLALLPRLLQEGGEERDRRLRDLWEQIVPPHPLAEVLALLEPGPRAELGEEVLGPWWPAVARAEVAKEGEPEVWPAYLRWLHRAARPVLPAAARVEELLEEAPRESALSGYRRLARICSESGLGAFATRLLLQREIPLLAPAAARIRLEDAIRLLLAGDGGADAYLAPYLGDPGTAGAVLESLADRVTEGSTEETGVETWSRCRRLLAAQRRPALPRAAAGVAGAFVARLASSPLADRTAEALDLLADLGPPDGPVGNRGPFRDEAMAEAARRLAATMLAAPAAGAGPARGLPGLLAARLQDRRQDPRQDRPLDRPLDRLGGEPEEAVDRALLGALAPALILVGPARGGGSRLRAYLVRYLEHLLDRGRWLEVTEAGGPWRHLLLDELLAEPPHHPEDDPRYRAYLELAWSRWSAAAGTAGEGAAAIAVLRAVPLAAGPAAGATWHRRLVRSGVPARLRPAAETLLAGLLASPPRGQRSILPRL